MYISSIHIAREFILILWILLHSRNQAAALRCYQCGSTSDNPCFLDPEQSQFEKECLQFRNVKSTLLILQHINFPVFSSKLSDAVTTGTKIVDDLKDFECITVIGMTKNNTGVIRSCVRKNVTCEMFAEELKTTSPGLITESCHRCNTDLCNSGGQLIINFFLFIALIILIQF